MKICIKMIKEIIDKRLLQRIVIMIVLLLSAGMIEPFITWIYKVIIDCISDFSEIDLQIIVFVIFAYEILQCLIQILNYVKEHFFFQESIISLVKYYEKYTSKIKILIWKNLKPKSI